MFLCVFAEEEVLKLQSFNFWYLPNEGLLNSASKKSQKVLVMVVFFLIYFAMLSLVFELKHNLEASHTLKWTLNHQKGWDYYVALWEK